MPSIRECTARVLQNVGSKVVIMIGDREYEIDWQGPLPQIGDIYLVNLTNPIKVLKKISSTLPQAWNREGDAFRWRQRNSQGKTRMEALWARHKIRRAVRDYMDSEGFIEIDTPLAVHGTTPDAAINSFSVYDRYLITSSEYQLRRLEVGGFDRLYTLTKNFRKDDGSGSTRNPEFTMLEWVRVGESFKSVESDIEQLTTRAHQLLGGGQMLTFQNRQIDLTLPWQRMTVSEAVEKYVGASMPDFSLETIRSGVEKAGLKIKDEWKDDISFLYSLLIDHVQSYLGWDRPIFLHDWPSFQTSTAQEKENSGVVERSELYIGGIEIANGFPSFTDYEQQKIANQKQLDRRKYEGLPPVELDESYMESMRQGLPPDAGMALGFDRLVMVLTDQPDIRSTLAFAWDEV